ncbi:prepilin-type N-terminal cleavage/methylation domain-containing protein [Pseudomonas sp. GD03842]|uniref:type IV pilin protein n=1 Tax=Pseudomonas sp. GD03842 TaxID=2975385 RepID=UPI0024479B48|nr:type IV pilin protein [Pseudomonas sp. GD03842]MDH0747928.1 prepilin-type N-terminal cleavage/methylation domain-containing protein [Pseudomonas sp. GD03842]
MKGRGFTLVELLIAIAVAAILASIAYPAYSEHVRKVRRAEIAALLIDEAHRLERFYSKAGQYSDSQGPPVRQHEVSEGNAFYVIEAERSQRAFSLTALPRAGTSMSGDRCGGFVIDHTGRRDNQGMAGDASVEWCWGR